jgi:hypothetical protein
MAAAAAGGNALYYWTLAIAAAGTVVQTQDQIAANRERQKILEQELRSNELAALDEENNRLIALRLANDDMLVNAGGVDAWASPSLIAGRAFNFQMGMQDIANIRFNVADSRAAISARIGILQNNSSAIKTAGIFEVAGIFAKGASSASLLAKSTTTPATTPATTPTTKPRSGGPK